MHDFTAFPIHGLNIPELPDVSPVTDTSLFIMERAGTGRIPATALRAYLASTVLKFANIAALRANTVGSVSATAVQVGGYYAINDGGGGTFVCNPGDTTTPDNAGTAIVDAIGQRWFRDTGGGPLSVRWFGAKGDNTTDDQPAIQAAVSTGQSVYIPPGFYLVKDAITCAHPGQLIQGAGRWDSVIVVNTTWKFTANGVFVFTSGEPAAYLKSFKIRFVQPDTNVRANLVAYPAAIYANAQPRFILEEMSICNAMTAVNMGGNSGGAMIRDLQASFYTYGVYIDGCVDSVRIRDLHCAGFEMTANQLSITQTLGTTCIASGRCDDLKLEDCLFLFYSDLSLFAGAAGYTFGSAAGCAFDGFNGISQDSGGRFLVSASYFTATQGNFTAVNLTSGTLYIDNCWFGQANSAGIGFVIMNVATGNQGRLLLDNCSFEHNNADVSSVVVNAAGTGSAEALISNCHFNRFPNTTYTQPTISLGASVGCYLTLTGCRTPQIGTGSGTFVSIPTDNLHRITGNMAYGWNMALPAASLGAYVGNSGGLAGYLTGTGGGSIPTATSANAASVVLPAGDWDVHGRVVFAATGGAAPTSLLAGVSTTSGGFSGAADAGGQQSLTATFGANSSNALSTSTTRLQLNVSTTVYLVAQANFPSGSMSATGFIGARKAA